ncbi:MAG: LuxR C-terminal-related transcriptional regulator [Chloroflexota bacterium]
MLQVVAVESSRRSGLIWIGAAEIDVVLIDNVSLISDFRESGHNVRAIVLGAAGDPEITLASIRAGAAACIGENALPSMLANVIRRVHSGEIVYEQGILLELVLRPTAVPQTGPRRTAKLSDREIEVLKAMATGASSMEAADMLGISLNTVRTHLKNILVKTKARSKLEAVTMAIREGRIELPPESP